MKKLEEFNNFVKELVKQDSLNFIISDFLDWFKEKLNLNFNKKNPEFFLRKGEIYFVNLGLNIGSELNKIRPCIIVSVKRANFGNTVLVVSLKSFKKQKLNDFQIFVKKTEINGLKKDSVIDLSSIRQVSKKRLLNKIGKLDKVYLEKLNKGMIFIFGIKKREGTPLS